MADIILKCRYLSPRAKSHAGNLIRYIATREGVVIDKRENYVGYIAMRPGAEKRGAHGLFSAGEEKLFLSKVAREVAAHEGIVWTNILSITRKDAERLGYETAEAWRTLLKANTHLMADAMKIPAGDLIWYAAFHNEAHHPHIHMVAYSKGKEPYLSEAGIQKMKSAFARMGLLYEEAGYHNAVFCGKDENGVMRHANKRGTLRNSTFKGNQAGSLPQYSFHYSGSSDTIYFFEAPLDMLSYISLQKENWRVHSYAAACSVSDQVLLHQLKLHANLKKCVLCLDNDLAGYRAGERICEKLLEKGYEVEVDYPRKKDWNEELLQRQEQEKERALCPAMRY